MEEILTYLISRHRGDLIELAAQSVDHKTLCLSFFTMILFWHSIVNLKSFRLKSPRCRVVNTVLRLAVCFSSLCKFDLVFHTSSAIPGHSPRK